MKFSYRWTKEEQSKLPLKPYTYATTFSGAGGSSMGLHYLNRYRNIFFNEVAPRQIKAYKANLNTLYGFEMPIQDLLKQDLRGECYNLDILQASFPCTLFSVSNLKADEKKGKCDNKMVECAGIEQVIDELYIPAIDLCHKLQPKVLIMENVKGLTFKKNKPYMDDIYKRLHEINYKVRHYIVKGETLGLPQKRHRLFIIAIREDLEFNDFNLDFNEPLITIGMVKHDDVNDKPLTPVKLELIKHYQYGDNDFGVINKRVNNKRSHFSANLPISNVSTFNTITSKGDANIIVTPLEDGIFNFSYPTEQQLLQASSFPMDYTKTSRSLFYAIGMSVPPLMMAKVADKVEKHILEPFYNNQERG